MKKIPISGRLSRGLFVMMDDEDAERINGFPLVIQGNNRLVCQDIPLCQWVRPLTETEQVARKIVTCIDGNPLNVQKDNLAVVTLAEAIRMGRLRDTAKVFGEITKIRDENRRQRDREEAYDIEKGKRELSLLLRSVPERTPFRIIPINGQACYPMLHRFFVIDPKDYVEVKKYKWYVRGAYSYDLIRYEGKGKDSRTISINEIIPHADKYVTQLGEFKPGKIIDLRWVNEADIF